MLFKSEVAPKGLQFKPTEFQISGKYCTLMTVISYPKSIGLGYLSNINSIPGVKAVVKHIPIAFSSMQKMINKEIADLKLRYQNEKDKTMQESYRLDIESMEEFVSMLAATQSKTFDFQMHLMLTADSEDELSSLKIQVRNFLDSLGLRAVSLMFEQEKVLKSIIPIFPKQDIEDRIGIPIPTPTLAAMYPFVFDCIKDPGLSTLLGVDFSGGVILFNQFLYQIKKENNRNNANMIMLGTSGSGKSTAAKLLIRSHFRNQNQVICIDPEGELSDMADYFNGDFISLGRGGSYGLINPLEIIPDYEADDDSTEELSHAILTKALQEIKAFLKYLYPTIEDDVLALFSEVLLDTYKRYRIDYDTDFRTLKSEDYPTFDDVYATIKGRLLSMTEATQERSIMENLELKIRPLVKELRFFFTGHTSINIESDFVVFNIKELMNSDDNVKNASFFNILKYAWGLCLDKTINTVLMVDEAHVLLSSHNELGAEFLAQVQRRSRKYNTGTIIITQQPTDFASPNIITHGKAIFDNASYYLIMGLRKQAIEDLAKLVDLNETEQDEIKFFNQGEALFICGNRRMRISVVVTPEELESFGSGGGL